MHISLRSIRKQVFTLTVSSILFLTILCSCHSDRQNYITALPYEVTTLVRLDVASLKDKGIDWNSLLETWIGTGARLQELGLDYSQPLYAFLTNKGMMGVLIAVDDAEKLRNLLDTQGRKFGIKVSERDGLIWATQNERLFVFDDDKLLLTQNGGAYARRHMREWMKQSEMESGMSLPLFTLLQTQDAPLTLTSSLRNTPQVVQDVWSTLMGSKAKDSSMNMILSCDVKENKGILSLDMVPFSKADSLLLENFSTTFGKIEGRLIDETEQHSFAWAGLHIRNINPLATQLLSRSGIEDFIPLDESFTQAIRSFQGDLSFTTSSSSMDDFLVLAQVKDDSFLSWFPSLAAHTHIGAKKISPQRWTLVFDGANHEVRVVNHILSIKRNPEMDYSAMSLSVNKNTFKQEVRQSYFYLSMDAETFTKDLLEDIEDKKLAQLLKTRVAQLDRFTLRVTEPTHAELTLSMKEGKDFITSILK